MDSFEIVSSIENCYDVIMSFKLFDQGFSAAEVARMHKPSQDELLRDRLNKWKESEHVLTMLRKVQANERTLDKMEAALWQKATKRRR